MKFTIESSAFNPSPSLAAEKTRLGIGIFNQEWNFQNKNELFKREWFFRAWRKVFFHLFHALEREIICWVSGPSWGTKNQPEVLQTEVFSWTSAWDVRVKMLVLPGFGGPDRSVWPNVRKEIRPETSSFGWFFVPDLPKESFKAISFQELASQG